MPQAQLHLAACSWGSASYLLACLFSLHGSHCGEQLLQGGTLGAEGDGCAGQGGLGTSWVPENSVLWGQGHEFRKLLAGWAFGEPRLRQHWGFPRVLENETWVGIRPLCPGECSFIRSFTVIHLFIHLFVCSVNLY